MKYRYNIAKIPRQAGKSTTVSAFYAWTLTFFDAECCGVVAHKQNMAVEMVKRVKDIYKNLPFWMQSGVEEWNKMTISFENKSRLMAEATSDNSFSGFSLYLSVSTELCKMLIL